MRFTPFRPCKFSSIKKHIPSSTSLGEDPGYGTVIVTASISMSGKTSIFNRGSVSVPATKIINMSMFAATVFEINHLIIRSIILSDLSFQVSFLQPIHPDV